MTDNKPIPPEGRIIKESYNPEKVNGNGEKKAKSRRYFIIKILLGSFIVHCLFIFYMIYFKPLILKDYIAYFLTTNGALITVIGTWIAMTTHKKKKESE